MNQMELDIFMEKHGRDILSFCKYLTKNTDEAEDLCQDTFLLGIEKAEQYEDDSHAKNYMLSIAVRLWKNRKRKYAWRRRIMDEQIIPKSEYEQENTGEINSPEAVVIKNEEHAFVRECVDRLPEKKRMVILLYYMEGLKEKETKQADGSQTNGETQPKDETQIKGKTHTKDETQPTGETQTCGGYKVTLLGVVSGKDISDNYHIDDGNIVHDMTYAVVAIAKEDGSPMPDFTDEEYENTAFLVSPYIEGFAPHQLNIYSLGAGGGVSTVENGIMYHIMEVSNIEPFADHTIYLGVFDEMKTVFNEAFTYNKETGAISRNESYHGLNALFTLPIDKAKADPEKAAEILKDINIVPADDSEPKDSDDDEPVENDDSEPIKSVDKRDLISDEVREYKINLLTEVLAENHPEKITEYADPVESTRKVFTPSFDGKGYRYDFILPDGTEEWFSSPQKDYKDIFKTLEQDRTHIKFLYGYNNESGDIDSLLIIMHTLNDDGTVTSQTYVAKQK